MSRRSHRRCSIEKDVLRNFAKFIWKHMCQGLFLEKETLSGTGGVFMWILLTFSEHLKLAYVLNWLNISVKWFYMLNVLFGLQRTTCETETRVFQKNLTVFRRFQRVWKGCFGSKWVNLLLHGPSRS